MTRTVYSAGAQLRHPRRFLRQAGQDLARAGTIGWRLFVSNAKARHRRTLLGYLWLVLPTLLMTGIWMFLQSERLIEVGPVGMPYPVYVLAGMLLWQLFLDCLNAPLNQLKAGQALITRSRAPLEALVAAGALEAALGCAMRLLVLAPVLILYGVPAGPALLLVPFGLAALALLGLTFGIILAPASLLYEDVGRATALVTTLWFFLTPIVYAAPSGGLVALNPVTRLLETTRSWLTGGAAGPAELAVVVGAALPVLLAGLIMLRVARPHLVARLG